MSKQHKKKPTKQKEVDSNRPHFYIGLKGFGLSEFPRVFEENVSKEVDCEYFLSFSKKCSVLTERRPRGRIIECVRPEDPKKCGIKKRYEW